VAALPGFEAAHPHYVAEPANRDTAAAVGVAAIHLLRKNHQAVTAVLLADHWIEKEAAFTNLLRNVASLAQGAALVMICIISDRPVTSYGYIRKDARFNSSIWAKPRLRH
jgi:mannose-1-phosphate guanylyltransferase